MEQLRLWHFLEQMCVALAKEQNQNQVPLLQLVEAVVVLDSKLLDKVLSLFSKFVEIVMEVAK